MLPCCGGDFRLLHHIRDLHLLLRRQADRRRARGVVILTCTCCPPIDPAAHALQPNRQISA